MKMRTTMKAAVALAVALSLSGTPLLAQTAQTGQISGTAKDEAKKPYTDFSVRARDMQAGQIAATAPLDAEGAFTLPNLTPANYSLELVNKDGKVVCTSSADITQEYNLGGVVIDCNKIPVVWWILGAAAAAGITAGVVIGDDPASPAQ